MSEIGRKLLRREDLRHLTGRARFLDDLVIPGTLHAKFVRAPLAHARIVSIDTSAALGMPGVECIANGDDLARWAKPLRMAPPIVGLHPVTIEPMPTKKIRFDGDLVAVVVATSRVAAEDAAELVGVEYDVLPPVTSIAEALAHDTALVDDDLNSNLISHQNFSAGVKEVRAWTVLKGATAPQAAGVIHTDFERGFIRA